MRTSEFMARSMEGAKRVQRAWWSAMPALVLSCLLVSCGGLEIQVNRIVPKTSIVVVTASSVGEATSTSPTATSSRAPQGLDATPVPTPMAPPATNTAEVFPTTAVANTPAPSPTVAPSLAVAPTEDGRSAQAKATHVATYTGEARSNTSAVPLSGRAISPTSAGKITQLRLLDIEHANQLAWSPDGGLLAVAASDIRIYDARSWQEILKINISWASGIAFSPDGTILASASSEGVNLWKVDGGAQLLSLAGSKNSQDVAFSPDGQTLATATGETVKLWDVASGRELKTIIGNRSSVFCVAFSPAGRWLAAGSMGQVRAWDLDSGELTYELEHRNWVNDIVFSPDGRMLAADRGDSAIVLWDMASGTQSAVLEGHAGDVTSLAFSPDGRLLASSSRDLTIRLWDVSTGKELKALIGHSGWAQTVSFSPDGATLASGAQDQTRLWGVEE